MSEVSGNDRVTEIRYSVEPAEVITVPIDATLSVEGQAADAKAVGDAIQDVRDDIHIQVNDEEADAQGKVIITGSGIPVSTTDSTTIAAKVTAMDAKTGADIAVSGTDATLISAKLTALDAKTGADIPVSGEDATKIGAALAALDGKTGADIPVSAVDSTTVDAALGGLDDRVTALEEETPSAQDVVKSVNGVTPDTNGNVLLTQVPYAGNLVSDQNQAIAGTFIQRTTGGAASVQTGTAQLSTILGGRIWPDRVEEEITVAVDSESITVTYNRATLIAAISGGGSVTLTYSGSAWSADPATYGLTVSGTPDANDEIDITYVAEDRGTIIQATPGRYVSTGSNIYDYDNGYARVSKYADDALFGISGTYTALRYAATLTGEREVLTVSGGRFEVPGDGYVFAQGADANTKIWPCWGDWLDGYYGEDGTYTESEIDLTGVMENFPYGLMQAGGVRDEINLQEMLAISRVERMEYSAENLAAVEASGVQYEADTLYIYAEREVSVSYAITGVHDSFTANDHGMEFIDGTDAPVTVTALYGQDLKGKLQRDVLTISAQELTDEQQAQARENIGAAGPGMIVVKEYRCTYSIGASDSKAITFADLGLKALAGYEALGVVWTDTNSEAGQIYLGAAQVVQVIGTARPENIDAEIIMDDTDRNLFAAVWLKNTVNIAQNNQKLKVRVAYIRSELYGS